MSDSQAGAAGPAPGGAIARPVSVPTRLTRGQRILVATACLLGLAVNACAWLPFVPYFFARGNNDFVSTYVGATLAGSGKLYNADAVSRVEANLGDSAQALMFPRFPYYAALISPLRRLSYLHAYWVWQCVSLAALWAFVAFWPAPRRWMTLVACCWSLPLANCFIMGQDVTIVAAALAVSLALLYRGKPFAAGLVISLCSIKFQLFLTLPLLILSRRMWKFGGGLAAGGAALLGVSFVVEGWSWPAQNMRVLMMRSLTPSYSLMPNLNGLFAGQPHAVLLAAIASVVTIIAACLAMRAREFNVAFTAMLISGLLLSYHAFIADAVVLIPAGLLVFQHETRRVHRVVGLVLLSSLAFLPSRLERPPYSSGAVVLLALLAMAAGEVWGSYSRNSTMVAPAPPSCCGAG